MNLVHTRVRACPPEVLRAAIMGLRAVRLLVCDEFTILCSPYTPISCFAISCVPSGLASSTMMISHSRNLCRVAERRRKEMWRATWHSLLRKDLRHEPNDDGEVFALVVGWQNDRVLVRV